MGNAIAKVIFGDYNPSGKLSVSFPSASGQCPIYYNRPNTGRPASKSKFTSKYLDVSANALYPFGYGLSYTRFAYSNMKIKEKDDKLIVSVLVKNTGRMAGTETVQLYIQDVVAGLVRPVKELKGFKKITLDFGDESLVSIELHKSEMGYYNNNAEYILESGKFNIYIGGNSRDCLEKDIFIEFS